MENQELYAIDFEKIDFRKAEDLESLETEGKAEPIRKGKSLTIERFPKIELNPRTARQAMVLYEIIGPPVSKRRRV